MAFERLRWALFSRNAEAGKPISDPKSVFHDRARRWLFPCQPLVDRLHSPVIKRFRHKGSKPCLPPIIVVRTAGFRLGHLGFLARARWQL
jgi:hypothetical protein